MIFLLSNLSNLTSLYVIFVFRYVVGVDQILVNANTTTRSIECPKLVHKSARKSFERKHYTPVRLEKKIDEYERTNKYDAKNGNAHEKCNSYQ